MHGKKFQQSSRITSLLDITQTETMTQREMLLLYARNTTYQPCSLSSPGADSCEVGVNCIRRRGNVKAMPSKVGLVK